MNYLLIGLVCCLANFSYAQHSSENHLQQMEDISKTAQSDTVFIAVLLYNDIVAQDFAGPIEVFSKAKNLTRGKYKVFTIGLSSKEITTENKMLHIKPDYTIGNFPKVDYLLIPGASMPVIQQMMLDEKLSLLIKKWFLDPGVKLVSICTGSFLLANTGILDHKKATTHYFVADYFAAHYPNIQLVKDVRYVDGGKVITSSGVTSGIDAALYIVGQRSGKMIQTMINRALQYTYGNNEKWPEIQKGMRYRGK